MLNLAHFLRLDRSLAVLDLETTGFDPATHRICQIAVTLHYVNRDPIAWGSRINPEMPMPKEVTEIHGITDEDVIGAPTFKMVAPALAPKLVNVDICGYNVTFDIGFLRAEMKRCGVEWPWKGHVVDAYQIYKRRLPHNLGNAYVEFGGDDGVALPPGSKLEGAHDAGVDVRATELVLRGQLLRFPDLPRDVASLAAYCFPRKPNAIDQTGKIVWHLDEVCIAFGKHAKNGPTPLKQLDRGYMQWILDNDFPLDVKEIIQSALMGIYPTR